MTDKLFDSFIHEQLYHKESPIPQGLWEKIVAEKEKEKPVFIWWKNPKILLLSIIGVIVLASSGLYFNQLNTTINTASYNKKDNLLSNKNELNLNKTKNLKTEVNNNQPIIANTNLVNENKVQKLTESSRNNTLSQQERNIKHNGKIVYTKPKQTISAFTPQQLNNDINHYNTFTNNDAKEPHFFNDNYLSSPKIKQTGLLIGITNTINEPRFHSNLSTIETQFFTKSGVSMFATNAAPPIINIRKVFGLDDCPSANGATRNDWYIEGFGSADYTFKRVENISTSEAYLAKKDSAEKMSGGFTLGVRVSKSVADNLLFKTGLQFNQMFEQFKLTTENERRVTTTIITRTLVRTGLPDTTISDTTSLLQIGYRTQRSTNLYRSIELPILLSYEFGKPDSKYSFALTGGAIINLTTWNKGNTLNELNQVVTIDSKPAQNSFYTHQIGLSAYLSASVFRHLNDKWSLFAEPYLRYSLGKNNVASGFVQQFDAIGLNIGARLKLNK